MAVKKGNVAADLTSWKHQRPLLERCFTEAEKKYTASRTYAFPKGEKGIGHVLESASGRRSEVVETLLGAHFPSRDVRGYKLPRLAYPRKFIIRFIEMEERIERERS